MKNIALIYGGNSEEAKISIKSGLNIYKLLDKNKYKIYQVLLRGKNWRVLNPNCEEINEEIPFDTLKSFINNDKAINTGAEIDKTDFSFTHNGEKTLLNEAVIMIHGTPGENGLLQGYLEMLDIPFNTCSSFVSAITFDKHSCKRFLDNAEIKMAKDIYLIKGAKYNAEEIINKIGLPLFVKPTNGGSSFGVTKVKKIEELAPALDFVFKEYDSALIEEFIQGRELTNGIYKKNGETTYFPITEIITSREFFDYEAKYLGESKEVCPAEISKELTEQVQKLSEKI